MSELKKKKKETKNTEYSTRDGKLNLDFFSGLLFYAEQIKLK